MIINDSKLESLVLKGVIQRVNLEPIVSTEYDAIMHVMDKSPSVAIINYIMEETNGDRLAKKIKKINPDIKCILSSCDVLENRKYDNESIDKVIKTPINPQKLIEIILDFVI